MERRRRRKPFSRRRAKMVATFNVQSESDGEIPNIVDSAFLQDSRLLLLDQENCNLKVYDTDFRLMNGISFKKKNLYPQRIPKFGYNEVITVSGRLDEFPRSITVNPGDEVYVTFCGKKLQSRSSQKDTGTSQLPDRNSRIMRIMVNSKDVSRSEPLKSQFDYRGVAYVGEGLLAVTAGDDPGLFSLHRTDGLELTKKTTDRSGNLIVNKSKTRAYVSDWDGHTVHAIDLHSKGEVFTYQHKNLVGSRGMAVDRDGNIYVCGYWSHNIHQISPSGRHIKILLSKKDLPFRPRSIAFAPTGNIFVVVGNSETAAVFTMS